MSFYGPEPFDTAQAAYVWTGLNEPGFFYVEVEGRAPNYTSGITLQRDPHFVGGLKIDVMGWTGPLGKGTTPYKKDGAFPGLYAEKIVVQGSNKRMVIPVKEIPHDQAEKFFKGRVLAP